MTTEPLTPLMTQRSELLAHLRQPQEYDLAVVGGGAATGVPLGTSVHGVVGCGAGAAEGVGASAVGAGAEHPPASASPSSEASTSRPPCRSPIGRG